ncbi:hypothetical protein OS493_034570 [Desmophyllum pertusum]|uniref:Uncharacterized protein n=1 Tax=Desmophyllum pertusum TaxID=174260 RepID=A0A9X0CCW4_9CNID|nr:hypothetical protein OS493_034570 [Desmophyllum pertusum]
MQSGYKDHEQEQEGYQVPVGFQMSRNAPLREAPPNDYRILAIVSIFFCPLVGLLAIVMSYVTNQRYEEDDVKRAEDASRDTFFSAAAAIFFGIAIVLFFIFIVLIVPTFG